MKKTTVQSVIFLVLLVCAFFNPIVTPHYPWFKFIMLAGSAFYLFLGWYFPMVSDSSTSLVNELSGFVYATVFIASFMETWEMPLGKPLVYFCFVLALAQMIYMEWNRTRVRRDMLIQSIMLWLVSGCPLFV